MVFVAFLRIRHTEPTTTSQLPKAWHQYLCRPPEATWPVSTPPVPSGSKCLAPARLARGTLWSTTRSATSDPPGIAIFSQGHLPARRRPLASAVHTRPRGFQIPSIKRGQIPGFPQDGVGRGRTHPRLPTNSPRPRSFEAPLRGLFPSAASARLQVSQPTAASMRFPESAPAGKPQPWKSNRFQSLL